MTNVDIANTILAQFGGARKVALMTGARKFIAIQNGVQFQFPQPEAARGNFVRVVLTPADTYTVTFYTCRASRLTEVASYKDVYCDMLQGIFERQTGLYLSLG